MLVVECFRVYLVLAQSYWVSVEVMFGCIARAIQELYVTNTACTMPQTIKYILTIVKSNNELYQSFKPSLQRRQDCGVVADEGKAYQCGRGNHAEN